ncbi:MULTISPECIES: helix-turn-helix domain-containing protein [Nocardia]|uniref:helix-turn-helix domain-containing protein n=1 Tax=Nocardia TaxID=1817 RepID=UPI00397FAC34
MDTDTRRRPRPVRPCSPCSPNSSASSSSPTPATASPGPRRVGGRRRNSTVAQAETAQWLYDEQQHTVQQIADILGVKRSTLYGHLRKTAAH